MVQCILILNHTDFPEIPEKTTEMTSTTTKRITKTTEGKRSRKF